MMDALTLEDFGSAPETIPTATVAVAPDSASPDGSLEEVRLSAFEEGYRNGWDDCLAAETEAQHRIGADLAANLQDIAMVHAEARAEVLSALAPLFDQVIRQFLPRLAAEAVLPAVQAEVRQMAEVATTGSAVLLAAPTVCPALSRLLEREQGLDLSVRPEPAYAEGQVSIRFDGDRRDIDMQAAAEAMADAIRTFLDDAASISGSGNQGVAA